MPIRHITRSVRTASELPENEPDASSSAAPSSPLMVDAFELEPGPQVAFKAWPDLPDYDEDDGSYMPASNTRRGPQSDEQKAIHILKFMRETFPRFSLRILFETLLKSRHPEITNSVNTWKGNGGILELLDLLWAASGLRDDGVCEWVTEKAAQVCAREASWLTDRAADGPHSAYSCVLRVPARLLSIAQLKSFSIDDLLSIYSKTMPRLREILHAVVNKPIVLADAGNRNPEDVSTTV